MKISIIIPTKNRSNKLKKTIQHLEMQTYKDFDVIIVNDSKNKIQIKSSLDIKILNSCETGTSKARNIGIKNSNSEIIIFIGDDTYPEEKFVFEHHSFHKRHKDINYAMLGLIKWPEKYANDILYKFLNRGVQFDFDSLKPEQKTDFFHFYTSNISLKKIFLGSNYFNEKLNKPFYEDIELGYRLSKKNMKLIFNPKAIVIHDHRYSEGLLRNRAYYMGKNFKLLQTTIPNIHLPYTKSILNDFKLLVLSFLRIFSFKKIQYYHYLYISNFLKGYYEV